MTASDTQWHRQRARTEQRAQYRRRMVAVAGTALTPWALPALRMERGRWSKPLSTRRNANSFPPISISGTIGIPGRHPAFSRRAKPPLVVEHRARQERPRREKAHVPNPGYLYVLVNSSMPGLVKVGKTNRSPTDRAGELSGVTGVPTPFVVAFEQFFEHCDAAEDFVHTELEHMNYRMSPNREFFNAPVNSVIRIIMRAPGQTEPASFSVEEPMYNGLLSHIEIDISTFRLDAYKSPNPWDNLLAEAERYHYGLGDKIEDHREALRLYKQAANLGSLIAYRHIGDMYSWGHGVRENHEEALEYYKEGTRRGNYYCLMSMAHVFALHGHEDNFRKCTSRFFVTRAKRALAEIEEHGPLTIQKTNPYVLACVDHIIACIAKQYPIEHVKDLRGEKGEILAIMENISRKTIDQSILEEAQQWVRDNL
jgi:hypothetical protein